MKLPKLSKGDLVEIIWHDTHTPLRYDWMQMDEYEAWCDQKGSIIRTIGIYMGNKKHFIRLIGDSMVEDSAESSVLRPINVGIGYIEEIYVLKRKEK